MTDRLARFMEVGLLILGTIGVVGLPFIPQPNRYMEPWTLHAGIWWGVFGPCMLFIWFQWFKGWRFFR